MIDKENVLKNKKDFSDKKDSVNKEEIIPNIDLREPYGEDLLNLCFTTFNKYANKKNKNQIFTPPHITDFMCDIVRLTPNSHVLDPTCGSGSFLVQAMYKMMSKVANDDVDKKKSIKTSQLFGIELDDNSFGLAVTNMLMHRDGKSNIINDSCFKDNIKSWIENKKIDIVLMNPPFGAPKSNLHEECPVSRSGMDATKGLYFVYYIAKIVEKGYLATILPLQCAEVTNNAILEYKEKILKNNSLVACFTLPKDLFYPAASTESCIMLFKLGTPHCNYDKGTFFASCKDDGFVKSKKLGRIENKSWNITKKRWLDSFHKMEIIKEFSSVKKVNYSDTWLAEAYMDIDYSKLNDQTFIQTIRDYISYKVKVGKINND